MKISKLAGLVLCTFCASLLIGCMTEDPVGEAAERAALDDVDVEETSLAQDMSATLASPPCYGSTCNGKDPATTGCSNTANGPVYILQSATIWDGATAVGGVELRYSQWCNARWSRTYSYIGSKCIGAVMRDSGNSYDIAGTNYYVCTNSGVYGNMYGGVVARAKGYLYMNSNTSSYRQAVTNAQ